MRRRWPIVLALVFLVSWEARAEVRKLTILHTNDLHARFEPDEKGRGGFPELAALIARECAGNPGCLVLDAGDLVQGTPVSSIFQGVPVFEVANTLGLDATTLGNHEFDYGWKMIAEFQRVAEFPILAANLRHPDGLQLGDAPWTVLETDNGIRVGVIGVVTRELYYLTHPDRPRPWEVQPVVETVQRLLPEVSEECDLVVVLGHLVDAEEDALLDELEGFPFIIAGHGHSGLNEPKRKNGRAVLRVRAYGRQLGRLDAAVDLETDRVVDWSWKAIDVRAGEVEPDAKAARLVAEWEARVSERVDVPIGTAARSFTHDETRDLFERAFVEKTGADLAYINPGGVRDGLPAGGLLARHVWNAMPFDNVVLVGTFRGQELPRFLRERHGLEPNKKYKLATMDFNQAIWREFGMANLTFAESSQGVRDLLIAWIREQGELR